MRFSDRVFAANKIWHWFSLSLQIRTRKVVRVASQFDAMTLVGFIAWVGISYVLGWQRQWCYIKWFMAAMNCCFMWKCFFFFFCFCEWFTLGLCWCVNKFYISYVYHMTVVCYLMLSEWLTDKRFILYNIYLLFTYWWCWNMSNGFACNIVNVDILIVVEWYLWKSRRVIREICISWVIGINCVMTWVTYPLSDGTWRSIINYIHLG